MLVFGSYNTLNNKIQYSVCVPTLSDTRFPRESFDSRLLSGRGWDGCPEGQRHFNKPWVQNWTMFWGEFLLLLVYNFRRWLSNRKRLAVRKKPRQLDNVSSLVFALPACCDTMATGLSCVAMMYIDASVWQMMRGVVVLFTAALSVFALGNRLRPFHYVALLITTGGLFLVGLAAFLNIGRSARDVSIAGTHQLELGFGLFLMFVSQLFAAAQFTIEEYLLQGRRISSTKVVGMEGMWGIIIQGGLLLVFAHVQGDDHGVYEDIPDAIKMITSPHSSQLHFLILTYMVSVACYNGCGLQVTKTISAVTRCLVDCCRTLAVWVISLALYYNGYKEYGVPWTVYSWLQLAGFILLAIGTLCYNKVLCLPGFSYVDEMRIDEPPLANFWSPKINIYKGMDGAEVSPVWSPVSPGLLARFLDENSDSYRDRGAIDVVMVEN